MAVAIRGHANALCRAGDLMADIHPAAGLAAVRMPAYTDHHFSRALTP